MPDYRCPKCKNPMLCACKHCGNNRKVAEQWTNGEIISCSSCGFTAHVDVWLDIEWGQINSKVFEIWDVLSDEAWFLNKARLALKEE